jgi:uncharacterized protein (DUF58 family)
MDRHELFQRITTFPLTARNLAEDLLAGEFGSVFKGEGIEFDEVRLYEAGDDVRSIDWNVSARFGRPYVKMYREERDLTVCIVLDGSASMFTGRGALTRYEQGVLAAALIAFSAERTGQRLGAVFFSRDIAQVFMPRKGRAHIMAILSAALAEKHGGRGSGLGSALSGTSGLLKRRSLVVVVSDFLCVNWEQEMGNLGAKHDVIALRITDPLDREFPPTGLVSLGDNETDLRLRAPSSFSSFRADWVQWHEDRSRLWEAICRRSGAAALALSTDEDVAPALARFFRGRRR